MRIDVRINGTMYELNLDSDERKYSINVGKCKTICAKTVDFADGTGLLVRIVRGTNTFATVVCEDSDLFDEGRLRLLLSRLAEDGVTAAVATSMSEKLTAKCVGRFCFYDAVAVSLFALSVEGVKSKAKSCLCEINGRKCFVACDGVSITIHPEIKYLY